MFVACVAQSITYNRKFLFSITVKDKTAKVLILDKHFVSGIAHLLPTIQEA